MSLSRLDFLKLSGIVATVLLVSVIMGSVIAVAAPPNSPYSAGETLNPSCSPGDTNCTVALASGGGGDFAWTPETGANATSTTLIFGNGYISSASSTIATDLHVGNDVLATGLVDASHFVATSTTATSTFAGDITVNTNDLVIDTANERVGVGTTTPGATFSVDGGGMLFGGSNWATTTWNYGGSSLNLDIAYSAGLGGVPVPTWRPAIGGIGGLPYAFNTGALLVVGGGGVTDPLIGFGDTVNLGGSAQFTYDASDDHLDFSSAGEYRFDNRLWVNDNTLDAFLVDGGSQFDGVTQFTVGATFLGGIRDGSSSFGTNGYVLSTNGTNEVTWVAQTDTYDWEFTAADEISPTTTVSIDIISPGVYRHNNEHILSATSTDNLFVGLAGPASINSSAGNVAVGRGAFDAVVSSALNNTALGYVAGSSITEGDYNTLVGSAAGANITTGSQNTAVGVNALDANTTASFNSAFGFAALGANTTGGSNSAFGSNILGGNTTGSSNAALGSSAMTANTTGSNNVAIGASALTFNVSATRTVAIGSNAAVGVSGVNNQNGVYIGYRAGAAIDDGSDNNTVIGYQAGDSISSGANNVLLGYQAGENITTGSGNIIIGYDIDAPNATDNQALSIGNLIYGTNLNGGGTTISEGNIGIATSTPQYRFAVDGTVGFQGTNWATTTIGTFDNYLTFEGYDYFGAKIPQISGANSLTAYPLLVTRGATYITEPVSGSIVPSLGFSSASLSNTATIQYATSTSDLQFGGADEFSFDDWVNFQDKVTIGTSTDAFAINFLVHGETGLHATAGTKPLVVYSTTTEPLFAVDANGFIQMGSYTGGSALVNIQPTQYQDNTISNLLALNPYNQNQQGLFVATDGKVGVATSTPWKTFSVDGTVAFDNLLLNTGAAAASLCLSSENEVTRNTDNETCLTSSLRYKHDIEDLSDSLSAMDAINQFRPVTYEYNNIEGNRLGLIAEEVELIDPRLIGYDEEGQPNSVRYISIIPILIEGMQELWARIDLFDTRLTQLEEENELLKARLDAIDGGVVVEVEEPKTTNSGSGSSGGSSSTPDSDPEPVVAGTSTTTPEEPTEPEPTSTSTDPLPDSEEPVVEEENVPDPIDEEPVPEPEPVVEEETTPEPVIEEEPAPEAPTEEEVVE